ncbi:MAG TPA: enoyl-CoA hydratase/isomerase family protein [Vineibacter sp.]|nr:enoyl-CoA hydratase/isomerase family protein [Vineibacter sp.]
MDLIKLDFESGIVTVRLDAPPVNAVDLPFTEQLLAALQGLGQGGGIRGVVLTGAGKAFCAGVNVKVVPTYDAGQKRAMVRNINRMVTALYGLPWPVVAAVNGAAIGGGMVLALACDFRIASGEARFALAEVTAGIPFPAVPLVVLEDTLDPSTRRELALTGRAVDAADAQRLRIVGRIVEAADLIAQASSSVRQLAAAPGYATVKAQIRASALERMRTIVERDDDPMLAHWV